MRDHFGDVGPPIWRVEHPGFFLAKQPVFLRYAIQHTPKPDMLQQVFRVLHDHLKLGLRRRDLVDQQDHVLLKVPGPRNSRPALLNVPDHVALVEVQAGEARRLRFVDTPLNDSVRRSASYLATGSASCVPLRISCYTPVEYNFKLTMKLFTLDDAEVVANTLALIPITGFKQVN